MILISSSLRRGGVGLARLSSSVNKNHHNPRAVANSIHNYDWSFTSTTSLLQQSSPVTIHRWNSSKSNNHNHNNIHKRAVAALGHKQQTKKPSSQSKPDVTVPPPNTTTTTTDDNAIPTLATDETTKTNETSTNTVPTQATPAVSSNMVPPRISNPTGLNQFAPQIVVAGIGGAGGNAVNNMIARQLSGVEFLALNTDAQHLSTCLTDNRLQIGSSFTSGLGCGANPDAGRLAAEDSREEILEKIQHAHMVFITAGMGGGTGTGAAPVVAQLCYELGILTVGVVTVPFHFEGSHRMNLAQEGLARLQDTVDTLIVIPNQNLFALATEQTSFLEAFQMADDVLLAGVKSITDLMTTPGLINLDFADVQSIMQEMGSAMLGTGQSDHADDRAVQAAMQALDNPLLTKDMDISTAKGMLVNITGGNDMTLFEVDKAAQTITSQLKDPHTNIIFGSAYDESLEGSIRVSVVATGIDKIKT